LYINKTSYQINNINIETEILIFSELEEKLLNLPTSLKELWIKSKILNKREIIDMDHKLPFGCEVKYY
jgi:hypothetical protein